MRATDKLVESDTPEDIKRDVILFDQLANNYKPNSPFIWDDMEEGDYEEHFDKMIYNVPDLWKYLKSPAALRTFIDRSADEEQNKKAAAKLFMRT